MAMKEVPAVKSAPNEAPAKAATTKRTVKGKPGKLNRLAAAATAGVVASIAATGTTAATAGQTIRGIDGQIWYGPATGAEAIFANLTQFSISIDGQKINSSDRSTGVWGSSMTGRLNWDGDISGNLVQNSVDYTTFYNALVGNTQLNFSFRPQDITAGFAHTGVGVIQNVKLDSPEDGVAKFTAKVTGKGALVLGQVTAGGVA